MRTVEMRFNKMRAEAEKKEANFARHEAERIQAEAKARARVAGEAALL